ncbi:MAG: DNA cytosine methyltransferase [Candidatus Heimdallarchaeota archaeon]|nr:MAG: DNA cytosine methyltransferase [Candidatus Heimdallarchaeota archaeon]
MRIIDLFCGCGGFSFGFQLANPQNRISLAIDNDFRAIRTYVENIKVSRTLTKDIRKIHSNDILNLINPYKPDIVIASPPCEPFSVANPNRQKSAYNQLYSDKIGRLVLDTIRIIIDLEPIVFLIENVPQLASIELKELIIHEFSRSQYEKIHFNMLESSAFGVPSYRKRIFISNVELKSGSDTLGVSVREAFQSLPTPNLEMINHETVPLSPKIARKIAKTPPGGAVVYFKGSHGRVFRNFIRLLLNQPSPTVMGKSRFIHPYDKRLCTVREHARLMSYPDDFHFYGTIEWQYNQVGESVPPLMAKAVAQQIQTRFLKT